MNLWIVTMSSQVVNKQCNIPLDRLNDLRPFADNHLHKCRASMAVMRSRERRYGLGQLSRTAESRQILK